MDLPCNRPRRLRRPLRHLRQAKAPAGNDAVDALKTGVDALSGHDASGAMPSEDGLAAVMIPPITVGSDSSETAQVIKDLRASLGESGLLRPHR